MGEKKGIAPKSRIPKGSILANFYRALDKYGAKERRPKKSAQIRIVFALSLFLIGSSPPSDTCLNMTAKKKDMSLEADRYDEESPPWAQEGQTLLGQYPDDSLMLYVARTTPTLLYLDRALPHPPTKLENDIVILLLQTPYIISLRLLSYHSCISPCLL